MKNPRLLFALLLGLALLVTVPVIAKGSAWRPGPTLNQGWGKAGVHPERPKFIEHQVIVKFKPNKINLKTKRGEQLAATFGKSKKVETVKRSKVGNFAVLRDASKSTATLIHELRKDPSIEYVEPNFIQYVQTTPNDTEYSKLWGMHNTGQTVDGVAGTADADIDAPEAWSVNTGSTAVTVAVLDSGIAAGHPDLAGNVVAGYDFVSSDSTPEDLNDHGTHVAGAVSAVGNNAAGVTGVSWNVKIMPIRVANAAGAINGADFILGLNYAVAQGVKIVNYSAGGYTFSQAQYDAIASARSNGVLVVVAAGNDTNNNDGGLHSYPCDYDLDNIVCVAATDQNDTLASFSNYGAASVDVAAPGVNIYSTVPYHSLSEDFDGATAPGFTGTQFTASGTNNLWMTDGVVDLAAYGDTAYSPYSNNANGIITSNSFDTSSDDAVYLQYDYFIESEFDAGCTKDYLLVEVFNGSIWNEVRRYCGTLDMNTEMLNVSSYKSATMRIRFQWVTNSTDNNYIGAGINTLRIQVPNSVIGAYDFMDGTSMATPYVTGLAALLKSYKTTFTYLGLRNTILNNVDTKAGLSGKVVTGGRINAFTSISNVDGVAPTATVNYSTTAATSQSVIATLAPSETIIVTNNGASASRTFSTNGSFEFTFTDLAGNAGTATATVANIDTTAPVITIPAYTTTATNQDITVTATTNEGTLNATSHTFTANGAFDFVATDAASNATTSTVTISNIDKTAPVITIAPYTTIPTRSDITVTASTNEGTLNATSHTFTANGAFDFVATDAVGNSTTSTVTITNIDKSAPIIKTIKLTKGAFAYKLNGKTITIRPFATDYKGAVWARSVDYGPDGKIYIFINSGAYKKGQIKVFKADGKLLKAYNPYGGFATNGLNATAAVETNANVYLAVGTTKAGTTVKTYLVSASGLKSLTSLTATTKQGNVLVGFQKLYKTQYGLITMKQGDRKTLRVWKLNLVTNKFVEDKKMSKTKIKI